MARLDRFKQFLLTDYRGDSQADLTSASACDLVQRPVMEDWEHGSNFFLLKKKKKKAKYATVWLVGLTREK